MYFNWRPHNTSHLWILDSQTDLPFHTTHKYLSYKELSYKYLSYKALSYKALSYDWHYFYGILFT